MQLMQLAKHLLLAAALTPVSLLCAVSAAAQEEFQTVTASASCTADTVTVDARSDIECAVKCSQVSSRLSFSFINGACVLSNRSDCTVSGAETVFKKQMSTASSAYPGYEQQIDGRRFWVFQQRQTGQVLFNRTWTEYEQGFGNETEFWAGLQLIHNFAQSHTNTLRIEMTALTGAVYVGEWPSFTVAGASTNFTMNCGAMVSGSSNIINDPMVVNSGMQFSTFDRDNDAKTAGSCSADYGFGGFWFNNCMNINPNGLYSKTVTAGTSYMSCDYMGWQAFMSMRMMVQF